MSFPPALSMSTLATMVPHCPLLQSPPLPYRADMSTPANSINPLQRRAAAWRMLMICVIYAMTLAQSPEVAL